MLNKFHNTISPAARLEIGNLLQESERLLNQIKESRSDTKGHRATYKHVDAIFARVAALRQSGVTDFEALQAQADEVGHRITAEQVREQRAHERIFELYLKGKPDSTITAEVRGDDFLAGTAAPVYTEGPAGGVLVPMAFQREVSTGLAQVDPLLDPNVCTVVQENDFRLPPLQIPGWDLSAIKATKVGEGSHKASDAVPDTTQKVLNKFTYRLSLGASLEWEQDQRTFDSAMAAMGQAYGIGFARGIGEDLILGDGTTAAQGVLTGAADSGITTANAGKFVRADFTKIYFSVNRIYRKSPKCAWLMADSTYQQVRPPCAAGPPFEP